MLFPDFFNIFPPSAEASLWSHRHPPVCTFGNIPSHASPSPPGPPRPPRSLRAPLLSVSLFAIMADTQAPEAPVAAPEKPAAEAQNGGEEAPAAGAPEASNEGGQEITTNYDEVHETFDQMSLREDLLRGIFAYGFEKPSAIQQRGIMPMIAGRDTIAQAQSGMGKTATFVIGILQNIDTSVHKVQALILAPTRELAQQIQKVVVALGDYMGLNCHICIGGTLVVEDIRIFQNETPHVVVGTPGRVYDMIQRRALGTSQIKTFCLDEADEMLSRGFKEQIYDVFQFMPPTCQVGLFSATMPQDVLEMTQKVRTFFSYLLPACFLALVLQVWRQLCLTMSHLVVLVGLAALFVLRAMMF